MALRGNDRISPNTTRETNMSTLAPEELGYIIATNVRAALSAQAAEVEALRADAERWRQFRDGDCSVPAGPDYPAHDLVMARLNNATENYVREGSGVADYDAAVDACAARAALKERAPNVGIDRLAVGESESNDGLGPF